MAVRIKPKTYGPFTVPLGTDKKARIAVAPQQTVAVTSPATEDAATPVDFLVSALGACLALSFHHAAEQMAIDVGAVSVSVSARKAEDLPDRVGGYSATVSLDKTPEADQCAELVKRAKARCTVSNSLNAPVEMTVAGAD